MYEIMKNHTIAIESQTELNGMVLRVQRPEKDGSLQIFTFENDIWIKRKLENVRTAKSSYLFFTKGGTLPEGDHILDGEPMPTEKYISEKVYQPLLPATISSILIDRMKFKTAINSLIPNENTIDDLINRYNELQMAMASDKDGKWKWQQKYPTYEQIATTFREWLKENTSNQEMYDFIMRVSRAAIKRDDGNNNKKTFDYIQIEIGIPSKHSYPNRDKFIMKNKNELKNIALKRISELKTFQKFNIPIEQLKCTKAVVTGDNQIQFTFRKRGD